MAQRLELNDHLRDRPRRWVFPRAEVTSVQPSEHGEHHSTYTIAIRAHLDENDACAYEYIDD